MLDEPNVVNDIKVTSFRRGDFVVWVEDDKQNPNNLREKANPKLKWINILLNDLRQLESGCPQYEKMYSWWSHDSPWDAEAFDDVYKNSLSIILLIFIVLYKY